MKKILAFVIMGIFVINTFGTGAIKNNILKLSNDEYDMVIIAPEIFTNEIQPLIDHKNNYGIKTYLQTTENIYDSYLGRDESEQIKYYIKDAIESFGVNFVLLIGGRIGQTFQWFIPPRYSHVDDGFMHKEFLSDLYYADIYTENGEFNDWDSNGNNIFSEWYVDDSEPKDIIDLKPDVALGRLPCRSEEEVEVIVNKIIEYEETKIGKLWFHNALFIGGDTNPGAGDPFPYEGEVDCTYTAQYLDDYNITKLFVSDGTLTGYNDVISAFNNGNGFILFHGHGLQTGLFTHTIEGEQLGVFDTENISELHNKGMYPIMVAGCCLTTEFDVGIFNFLQIFKNLQQHHHFRTCKYECVPEVISWNLIKQKDAGTIAYIGDSSTAWGAEGDQNHDGIPDSINDGLTTGLCSEFFRIIGENSYDFLGMIYKNTLTNVINSYDGFDTRIHYKNVQEFQLIGDPSLKIGGYP